MRDGEQGYMVITPLEREGGSTILVNRGWISKNLADQKKRGKGSLPREEVVVEGMLRKPWPKNMFTPENRPDKWEFYFPDVKQMAELTGAQPVWIEATMSRYSWYLVHMVRLLMISYRPELYASHGVRGEGYSSRETG